MLEFSILGPLEIRSAGQTHQIHGYCQKALLISFLVADRQFLTRDSLICELWGAVPPERTDNALQAHISRLRRTLKNLEPQRSSARLQSRKSGYELQLDDNELDSQRFVREVNELNEQANRLHPDRLVEQLRRALSMWRGPVLGGVASGQICRAGGMRYEQARQDGLVMLYDGELRRGNHAGIVAELSALVATGSDHQERFAEQLMVALYRCGRQADALAIGRRISQRIMTTRNHISLRLRACEKAILSQNRTLDGDG